MSILLYLFVFIDKTVLFSLEAYKIFVLIEFLRELNFISVIMLSNIGWCFLETFLLWILWIVI